MAGVITQEADLRNNRVVSMWAEAGMQFRSNLLLAPGARIQLHAHSYDHVAFIEHGVFDVKEILPDGEMREYRVASAEFGLDLSRRVSIPAMHKHAFVLLERTGERPGEVLCVWPEA
jgi:hypothetical protein